LQTYIIFKVWHSKYTRIRHTKFTLH